MLVVTACFLYMHDQKIPVLLSAPQLKSLNNLRNVFYVSPQAVLGSY